MRTGCLDCARKHIGTAYVLLGEFFDDPEKYHAHLWYAIGHLEEASRETFVKYPEIAGVIREVRLKLLQDDSFMPHFDPILLTLTKLADLEIEQKKQAEKKQQRKK